MPMDEHDKRKLLLLESLDRLRHNNDFQALEKYLRSQVKTATEAAIQRDATPWDTGRLYGLLELPSMLDQLDELMGDFKRKRRIP